MSRWWRCWWWLGDDGEMTGGVELDAGDDIVASAGEKTGALDTDDTGGNDGTGE